ncbi:MAG: NADH-quinone oxidoreductase subunit C [Proteobacteria bacterium]|nr:MAG: NADH-quinone oxidoreductase subunit C [Pseudomonadota bacterium]
MRRYEDRKNSQKKVYHKDRFRTAPCISREEVKEKSAFYLHVSKLKKIVDIKEYYIELDQLVIWVDKDDIFKAVSAMKEVGYENLSELSAVDFLASKNGFEIFYQFLSMQSHCRARVKCFLPKGEKLESVESIYKSANWAEREMYDMFGIICLNHPNLKRILMPDDWHGHPLLKSYPLHGDEAAKWYEIDKIFGKEYREVVGEEQRDSSRTNEEDTKNFARINHEVPYMMPKSDEPTGQEYQEDGGIAIVKKIKKEDSKIIEGRR